MGIEDNYQVMDNNEAIAGIASGEKNHWLVGIVNRSLIPVFSTNNTPYIDNDYIVPRSP